ncbi:fibronectin type III-like domain-contianing protein [Xanthomonas cucurbitae]|uniref:fibronectin type III-like domain-contianing protein n=1 Tax=Xanthomonas cucurbitae TaxID=56453 RepID=UPI002368C07A|nr:fibronectin type III-like domain-contianing protein [Xanthomonas cucurbitae]
MRELEDFRRVRLPGGGNVTVQFELRRAHLIFVGQAMTAIAKPGLLDVWLAPSASADGLPASFGLLGLCLLRRPAWRRWSSTRVHGRAAPRLITVDSLTKCKGIVVEKDLGWSEIAQSFSGSVVE